MDLHKAVTSGPSEADLGRQFFTLERAMRALPLVRRITEDIVRQYGELLTVQREYQAAIGLGPSDAIESIRDRRQQLLDRLQEYTAELQNIGCEIKDYECGLVDFPSVLEGREVYLCWKLGEETIGFWHEAYAGYAGRQALPRI